MILFAILMIILMMLIMALIFCLVVGGPAIIFAVGDVVIFIVILVWIFKKLFGKKDK